MSTKAPTATTTTGNESGSTVTNDGADAGTASALPTQTRTLTGWGRTAPTSSEVLSTSDPELIAKAVAMVAEDNDAKPPHLRRGVIARGSGAPTATMRRTPVAWSST